MVRSNFVIMAAGMMVLFFCSLLSADVPDSINYQGKLTTAAGFLVNDTVQMTFSIYPDTLPATPADWTETHDSVVVKYGVFDVILGSINPIPVSVFDGSTKYLEVQVESDPPMRPMKPIVSTAYAHRAAAADGGAGHWSVVDSVLYTNNYWGIARGGAENVVMNHTHINFGVACTTGYGSHTYSTVSGGFGNSAIKAGATVSGGKYNTARESYSNVGGGYNNCAYGSMSAIAGGEDDTATGDHSAIGGGRWNTASGEYGAIGGGLLNIASDYASTVGGGAENEALAWYTTVGGGRENTASDYYATVCGGYNNIAGNQRSIVVGGQGNTATGSSYGIILGGYNNYSLAYHGIILGGDNDTLGSSASRSMIFGNNVYVNNGNRVVFFEGTTHGRLGINRDDRNGGIGYPIHVGTSSSNGNGAFLTNGGVWTLGSSRSFKDNFQSLDGQQLLARISGLNIESWQYKDSDERHIGPYAEEFVDAFDVGVLKNDGTRENQYLAPVDIAGVALAGVKELARQNRELRLVIEELRHRITELEKKK